MMSALPIVHIVDDDVSFRTAIGDLLSACGYTVALYRSAAQLLEALPSDEPACVLLDVQMDGLSGPQLQDQLAGAGNRLPIVFVTGHGDIPTTVRAMKAGADDFLTKPVSKDRLLDAIQHALLRREEMRAQDSRTATMRSLFSRLTPREQEVFALLVRGKPHKQIAYALGTTERTVKMHRHNVMQKCQLQSLAELAVFAERLGSLAEPDTTGNEGLKLAKTASMPSASSDPSCNRRL